jgi:hypothetical protein
MFGVEVRTRVYKYYSSGLTTVVLKRGKMNGTPSVYLSE